MAHLFGHQHRGAATLEAQDRLADLMDSDQGQAGARFIPAHAGNADAEIADLTAHKVHPRARGERIAPGNSGELDRGSSPRTRGTPGTFSLSGPDSRFIPAHAGNAASVAGGRPTVAVHPRARGERAENVP